MIETMTAPHHETDRLVVSDYETGGFFDEMFDDSGSPRPAASLLARRLKALAEGELPRRQKAADTALLNMGITFNVYGHEAGTEKIWPFDLIPRIMEFQEWRFIEDGPVLPFEWAADSRLHRGYRASWACSSAAMKHCVFCAQSSTSGSQPRNTACLGSRRG